eukprot:gnl/MRDRNA2_/MRDRNA2_73598_c0_seq1.p1 gnl/MRDRNA2_/MRDRNA2_73598_c0~~gnl/MRDRNA2_/MRDRNA2_73598_c0_seq1.p1  ORF type:complete len:169 (+),score=41.58 gnl/MRDRNA2_/MRDRNA2_73598_c0_seq1:72-509(+)
MVPTFRVPTSSNIAASAIAANKAYGDLTRGKKGHTYGGRDGYILGGLCQGALESLIPAEQAQMQTFLSTHLPGSQPMTEVARLVTIEKNWEKQWKRVNLMLRPTDTELFNMVSKAICAQGGHRQWNSPPPSGLERELQEILAQRQ